MQAVQEIRGSLGVGGGLENGPLVLLQHLEPMVDIGGVIVARLPA